MRYLNIPLLVALFGCVTEASTLEIPDPTPAVSDGYCGSYSWDDAGVQGFGGSSAGRNRNPISDGPGWADGLPIEGLR